MFYIHYRRVMQPTESLSKNDTKEYLAGKHPVDYRELAVHIWPLMKALTQSECDCLNSAKTLPDMAQICIFVGPLGCTLPLQYLP